jgi:hypothetical protein
MGVAASVDRVGIESSTEGIVKPERSGVALANVDGSTVGVGAIALCSGIRPLASAVAKLRRRVIASGFNQASCVFL